MKDSKKRCDVCGVEQAEGVFSSRIAPVSSVYCRDCLEKGAEPYGILVIHVAHLLLSDPGYQLDPFIERVKQATLDITGKTEETFQQDVQNRRKEM